MFCIGHSKALRSLIQCARLLSSVDRSFNIAADNDMALRIFMQAKVACSNTIHNLETIDGITDDWTNADDTLESDALDVHLNCQYAAEECLAITKIIDQFFANAAGSDQIFKLEEMSVRAENAAKNIKKIELLVEKVKSHGGEAADGSTELKRRCEHITEALDEAKGNVEELQRQGGHVQTKT